jgi:hypothetical protein
MENFGYRCTTVPVGEGGSAKVLTEEEIEQFLL